MDSYEKLNNLYSQHQGKFDGQFHNALWQVMINDSLDGLHACWAILLTDGSLILARADGGYIPASCRFRADVSETDRQATINDLNDQVFGLTPEGADRIEMQSYARNRTSKPMPEDDDPCDLNPDDDGTHEWEKQDDDGHWHCVHCGVDGGI